MVKQPNSTLNSITVRKYFNIWVTNYPKNTSTNNITMGADTTYLRPSLKHISISIKTLNLDINSIKYI